MDGVGVVVEEDRWKGSEEESEVRVVAESLKGLAVCLNMTARSA